MRIQYVDRTCIGITSEEGVVIVIDPVEAGGFAGPGDEARLWADIAVLTHGEDKQAGLKSLKGDPIQITGRCQHEIKGITIRGMPCPSPQQEEVGKPPVTIFKFDIDGLRLLHLGPLGHVPGPEWKKEIGAVDLLFVPVGGYGTLNAAQAEDVIDRFEPRVVVPLHRPGGMIGFEAESVDSFLQGRKGIKRLPNLTEVSRHSMPSSREIWVLSLK